MVLAATQTVVVYRALLEIFIFIALAEILHSFGQRVGLPGIVTDLLVGMVLSAYAIGGIIDGLTGKPPIFTVNSYVVLFADFSVVLMLFAAGLGGGFSSLRTAGFLAAFAAVAGDLVPFVITFVALSPFYPLLTTALLSVAVAATSSAVVATLIRTEHVGNTLGARFLMNVAALDDVVALVLLSAVLTITGTTGKLDILSVTGSVAEAVAAWVILLLVAVLIVPRLFRIERVRASRDVPFFVLFAIVAIVVALGFSAVIGAYIAGLAIAESLVAIRTRLVTQILLTLFGSLFFVVIGAQFDVRLLSNPSLLLLGLALTGLASAGKLVVWPFARLRLENPSDATTVTFGMIPRGEIGLIVAALGIASGALTQTELGAIVLMSIATTLIGAILFRRRVGRLARPPPDGSDPVLDSAPPSAGRAAIGSSG
jgi:Kef-type K+ transport system membrane component KefB